MYSHETRVALVKERVKEIERQRKRRARSGALILAALAAGTALGERKGDKVWKRSSGMSLRGK